MGNRNYGLRFRNAEEFRRIVQLVQAHNDLDRNGTDTGSEELSLACIVVFKGELYASINSQGGRADRWIRSYLNESPDWDAVFIQSGEKPEGWFLPNNENVVKRTDGDSLRERFPWIQDDLVEALRREAL